MLIFASLLVAIGSGGRNVAAARGAGKGCCCNGLPIAVVANVVAPVCTTGIVSGRVSTGGCGIQVALFGGCRTCVPGCVVKRVAFCVSGKHEADVTWVRLVPAIVYLGDGGPVPAAGICVAMARGGTLVGCISSCIFCNWSGVKCGN